MTDQTTPVLVVSGSIGAGKTTVLGEIADLLRSCGESFGAVDYDAFTQVFPAPEDDPFRIRFGATVLGGYWKAAAGQGATRLVIAGVVESEADLAAMLEGIPGAEPFVVHLAVDMGTLERRVTRRETGSGRDWHLARTAELHRALPRPGTIDAVVEAGDDRTVGEVAGEILRLAGWPLPTTDQSR